MRDHARLRRADRPQPGPGRCRADRRRAAAGRHRAGGRRRRQRGPGRGDAGRDRRGQRPDGQHDRGRGTHPRAALRGRAADRAGRRLAPARRVEARRVHRARAARAHPGHRRSRQDRPGDRRAGPGDGDDGPRCRPVRHRRGGREPWRRIDRLRRDARARRRLDRPRPADARDARPHRSRCDRADEARVDRPQRGARRRGRRGRRRRRAPVRPSRRCRDRRLRARAADRLAAARCPEHAADAAPRGIHGRGPDPRLRGGRRAGARRARWPERALRRQRPAADPGNRPGDRAVPAARRGARPLLRPVLARWRADADPRDRR